MALTAIHSKIALWVFCVWSLLYGAVLSVVPGFAINLLGKKEKKQVALLLLPFYVM